MESAALATSSDDLDYIRARYVPLDLAKGELADWIGRALPEPTYRFVDGSGWVPHDWLRLYDDAGRRPERVHGLFARRLAAASDALGFARDPDQEWASYLRGFYGACLREVTPENIVAKERLVHCIDRWLVDPRPDDVFWRDRMRADVEALDGITRPFAACDRDRFGPTSRDRLITQVRRAYPTVFADGPASLT
jgi:hypothetical protein